MITNEFQTAEQQQDLEALRNFIPSFETADIEPFIRDTPVIAPTWNKVKLDAISTSVEPSSSSAPKTGSQGVYVAAQVGASIIPMLMTPVEGTLFENA